MSWSIALGLVVIIAMIIVRFWPLIDAARKKRRTAAAELITRLTSVEQKTTTSVSQTPATNVSKRWTDGIPWWFTLILVIGAVSGAISVYDIVTGSNARPIFGDGKPASAPSKASVPGGNKGKWITIKEVRDCFIGWNAMEAGVWCEAMYLSKGKYRTREKYTSTWKHWDTGADGRNYAYEIPAKGTPVRNIWNPSTDFYQEFLEDAPIPSMPFGRLIAIADTTTKYSEWSHESFSIYGTEQVKVLFGLNIPPVEKYITLDKGQLIPFDIQKWVE